MSQSGTLQVNTGGNPTVEFLTGNTGGPVGPDGSHNINLLGNNTSGINIVGTPLTNTLTVVGIQSTTSQRGTVLLATDAQAIAGTDTNNALTSSNLAAKLGTQTAHSLAVFQGTSSALTALGVASNGQIPIGSTGADPVLGSITSSGGTITVTGGPGTINIDVAASSHVVETLTGNSGGAIAPTAGNINTLGTGSITIVGSGSTLTSQLTGLTNHAIQIGAGTATLTQLGAGSTGQILQTNTTADPTWSTATYPSTTTINQILYSSSANVVGGLATANNGVLTTGTGGAPVITALGTDGQVIIGSSAGAPAAATISAGAGISVTNGHNTITIAATGEGFTWTDVTGATQTIVAENGYLADRAGGVAFTLPASGTIGDTFRIVGLQGSWTLAQAANQQIKFGSLATTVGVTGSLASNNAGDCIECVATNTSASTVWRVMSSMGNITVA